MNFFVRSINEYSEKSNKVSISFIGIQDIDPNFQFSIYIPKSIKDIEAEKECDIPFFIAKNIWIGYFTPKIVKALVKHTKSIAEKGDKISAGKRAEKAFYEAEKLNIEKEIVYDQIGNFVGKVGDEIVMYLNKPTKLFHNSYASSIWKHNGFGWIHPTIEKMTWKCFDNEGNVILIKSSSDTINCELGGKDLLLIKGEILQHSEFRGERQTVIKISRII